MKIHDLVDTSRAATQHMRDTGAQTVLPLLGTIPLTRATLHEPLPKDPNVPLNTITFPESGGLRWSHTHWMRGSGSIQSGLFYNFDMLERGLTERDTQINLSWTQTYRVLPNANTASAWVDCCYVMRSKAGAYYYYNMAAAKSVLADTFTPMKRELVIDRKRKIISLYSKHPKTGVVTKNTYNYASQFFSSQMDLIGVLVGLVGTFSAPGTNNFAYNSQWEMEYDNILLTENDLPTDPPRHGPFDLATFANVVQSSHPNAATLNASRVVPPVVTDRYQGKPSVPITKDTPLTLTLRPTLLTDAVAQGKGRCLAVLVTGDIKNTSGKNVCKAQVQDGRLARFTTPRTHPFQQSIGMPGIGATFAQLDLRKPDGDLDASALGKSVTLGII